MTGAELKQWLGDFDIGVREFARKLGVQPSTVARWLNGSRPVPAYMEWVLKGIEHNH